MGANTLILGVLVELTDPSEGIPLAEVELDKLDALTRATIFQHVCAQCPPSQAFHPGKNR